MDDKNDEIEKRKKVRKTLLFTINDEMKILKNSKPSLMINSQTIEDFENIYNTSNILLSEKGTFYSNYIKTETIIYPPIPIPARRIQSVEKKRENSMMKIDLIGSSFEEDVVSPILNFFPKKIDLASKKLTNEKKRYTRNIEFQNFFDNNLNTDKSISKDEDQLNKSTKIENNKLEKLIEKILSIKNNENMEKIIKRNIKKLRKYCYKYRKKKKKNKNNKSRNTRNNKSQEHKIKVHATTSKNLLIKINEKEKEKKISNLKMFLQSSSKKQKTYLSIKNKRKPIKLKTLNEDDGSSILITLNKMKMIKPIKIIKNNKANTNEDSNNNNENDAIPSINNIKKELMRSSVNKKPSKYDIRNPEKTKSKNKKKIKLRNRSLFQGKDIEKMNFSVKKDKKLDIHNSLIKSNKKIKKLEIKLDNKNSTIVQKLIKTKKINVSKRKSKKKLIESPLNKNDYYSNCNTNYNTNIFTLTQTTTDKIIKNIRKKSNNKI